MKENILTLIQVGVTLRDNQAELENMEWRCEDFEVDSDFWINFTQPLKDIGNVIANLLYLSSEKRAVWLETFFDYCRFGYVTHQINGKKILIDSPDALYEMFAEKN